jgi:tetratricopeptide (TPR) repeat protein/transglutaminase-like putative cysteine protease
VPRIEHPSLALSALLLLSLCIPPSLRAQSNANPPAPPNESRPQSSAAPAGNPNASTAAPAQEKSTSSAIKPPAANSGPPDYSKEPYVIESTITKMRFENDGTYSFEVTQRARVQSQAGLQQLGVLQFPYAAATSALEVEYVRVVKPDGRIVETSPENALDMPADITRQAPSYSDLHTEQIAVKGLEIGDHVEAQYRVTAKKPLDPGQFWESYNFVKSVITLDDELEISVPQERAVTVKSGRVQPSSTVADGRRVYLWKTSCLVVKNAKKSSAGQDADDANVPDVQITTFGSWDELGQWVKSLVAPRAAVTPEIQAKADELTRGAKTDPEKIQLLYNFVSTQFRYIGISLGIGRYQPHAAADVLSNDYGDCKDKHTLFAALLAAEKITAFPALLNSNSKIDPELPSPLQFDHMITAIPQKNGFLFLDTTPGVAPFGYLTANLRKKQALVIPSSGPALLVPTPQDPPFKSSETFFADGALDDAGTFQGKMQMTLRSDSELVFRLLFRQAGQSRYKDVMQSVSASLSFGGTVSNVTVTPPDQTDVPFHIAYDYERKKFGDWEHRQISPPLPPMFLPAAPDESDSDLKPILVGSPFEGLHQATMKLPSGANPHLPAPVYLHENFAEYHATYSVVKGVLHVERRLITKQREIAVADIPAYRRFVKVMVDDETTFIPLFGDSFASDSDSTENSVNPDAFTLLQKGREAWQDHHMPEALQDFQQAVAKDPSSAAAWLYLGATHFITGAVDQGMEEMKKAIALDPSNVDALKYLASMLASKNRNQEALEVWQKLEKASPQDSDAPHNIAEILAHQKKYPEAVAELQAAVDRNPDNTGFVLQLGEIYLEAGNNEKAIAAIEKAADEEPTAATLNDAAYALADKGLDLDHALKYAERSVAESESDSAEIDLDNLVFDNLKLMTSLANGWDTLGWVQFRMGRFDLAEKYLNAAWSLTQDPVIADHLGQLYEKMGKTHEAAVAYSHALSTIRGGPDSSETRLKALRPGEKYQAGEGPDPGALQALRTVSLKRTSARHATAEFFILFASDAKVPEVKFISGSQSLQDAGKDLAAAKFTVPFPDSAPARILRRGILDCEPELRGCMFVLIPTDSVQAID